MNTVLIIHPKDHSTDFLKKIYEDIEDKVVLSDNLAPEKIFAELQKDYQTVMLLGHGWQGGLYDLKERRTVVGLECKEALQNKTVIGIFCNADEFFRLAGLHGFSTGMFISEPEEAIDYAIVASYEQINESSTAFAEVMKNAVASGKVNLIKGYIAKNYVTENNPVIIANRQFMGIDPWTDEERYTIV